MKLRLGATIPDFEADTTFGIINFHEWLGDSWGLFFSHPYNFTPVCTTELGKAAKLKPWFDQHNVKIIGMSIDTVKEHEKWIKDIQKTQDCLMNYPIIGDPKREISYQFGLIHPDEESNATVRSVIFISPDKKIKAIITYPIELGRSFSEIQRVVESLQRTYNTGLASPVDWQIGDDMVILGSVDEQKAKALFPDGWKQDNDYMRYIPDPGLGPKHKRTKS